MNTALPLYTPDSEFLATGSGKPLKSRTNSNLDDDSFKELFEIDRTVQEILDRGFARVALQFPDELLGDSTRVYNLLAKAINDGISPSLPRMENTSRNGGATECCKGGGNSCDDGREPRGAQPSTESMPEERKVFILADTSYSACCIDEIAAEHCEADVIVHYGRSCLSPTTRLPVIYVFTSNRLDLSSVVESFCKAFPDKGNQIVLMADITYSSNIAPLHRILTEKHGYKNLYATEVIHDPSSLIPNRTLPPDCAREGQEENLKLYNLFHLYPPLPSLLLVLASRVSSIHTYDPSSSGVASGPASTTALLRRRYAIVSHARTAGIIGILVNTLNVKNYLPVISMLKRQIRDAGRKSYLVVVGKVNVEKVANFTEVEVWVGVGCWEQGIVGSESGKEFYRPVITPFELGVALDKEKVWTGEWITDFESILKINSGGVNEEIPTRGEPHQLEDEDEDEPPEFDLRTGRYISTSKPLHQKANALTGSEDPETPSAMTLASSASKQLSATGRVLSPAADYLREKRTWRGLGSDVIIEYEQEGAVVEIGRSGIARGYTVGGQGEQR